MRGSRFVPLVGLSWSLLSACADPGPAQGTDSATTGTSTTEASADVPTTGPTCAPGDIVCQGDSALLCGPSGHYGAPAACPVQCVDGLGCVDCEPGTFACEGDALVQCGDDGKPGGVVSVCDPLQGLACDAGAGAGACTGACAFDPARPADLGCEFWAVPLPAYVGFIGGYGVGIDNTCDVPASVAIELSGKIIITDAVPALATTFFQLPRAVAFLTAQESLLVPDVSFRIRTDCPVSAVQLSNSPESEATGEVSRLYPTDRWGREVAVATQRTMQFDPNAPFVHSYLAVVPRDDATTVTVTLPDGVSVKPVEGIGADGQGAAVVDRGEVLLLVAEPDGDLSGALVTADRPVEVFGGHECAWVPSDVGYCDHLEEGMPPLPALGDDYIVVPPAGQDQSGARVEHVVRVVAQEDGVVVTTSDPMLSGQLDRGELVEFGPVLAPLRIQASAPVLVAQYLVGLQANPLASDPSLLVPVPVAQFRPVHTLWTPDDWTVNFVDIVAPAGASVLLDGADVAGFAPLAGVDGFEAVALPVDAGRHVVSADTAVGVVVYGYSGGTASYAYSSALLSPAP